MPSKGVLAWLRFQKCLSSYKYKTDYPKYDYFYISLLSESFSPWSFLQKMCQITTSFNLVWKSWWQWFGTFFGENETIAGQKNAFFFTFYHIFCMVWIRSQPRKTFNLYENIFGHLIQGSKYNFFVKCTYAHKKRCKYAWSLVKYKYWNIK